MVHLAVLSTIGQGISPETVKDMLQNKSILSNYSNKPRIDEKSVILSHSIPPGDLLSLLGK